MTAINSSPFASSDHTSATRLVSVSCARRVKGLLSRRRTRQSFVKRAIRFFDVVSFDVHEAVLRALDQRKQVDDLLGMLAKRSPMPGPQGIPYLTDANRRYCETLRPFLEALSNAVATVEKLPPLSPNTGYKKRVEFIRKTRFAGIVICLDPDIRHSESHDGTDYDDANARVFLTEVENGVRRKLGEYTYWQISDMTLELQNGLFLAVINAFALHEVGVLTTAAVSPEYFTVLTSIGNLADSA